MNITMQYIHQSLTTAVGEKVENLATLLQTIKSPDKALDAATFLDTIIIELETEKHSGFCNGGIGILKTAYNQICDKYPEIRESIHPNYVIEHPNPHSCK